MIFAHTLPWVLDGRKSQTRRICKPRQVLEDLSVFDTRRGLAVMTISKREDPRPMVLYEVGKTYAVQPARGQKAVARIEVLSIRQEDVRNISEEDVKAEGFESQHGRDGKLLFLLTWASMHDKKVHDVIMRETTGNSLYPFSQRPPERYLAWALTFKIVEAVR